MFDPVHLFRHLLLSSLSTWNEGKSAKSEIFRQTDFLTKWGEILHNMVRGGNNQILWLQELTQSEKHLILCK